MAGGPKAQQSSMQSKVPTDNPLAYTQSQMDANAEPSPSRASGSRSKSVNEDSTYSSLEPDFDAMELLLTSPDSADEINHKQHTLVRHAPLIDESIVRDVSTRADLPQYGLMGTHNHTINDQPSKLFLNTNVPFSAFVCGIQGSGKSYTASCILENCLIPSKNLGILQQPLSALVFSYGLFTGNGAGFHISEAAHLGSPNHRFGDSHVKKINVLVCEENINRIRQLYEHQKNVTVSCFKLDPRDLDIELMLTLMNIDDSGRVPLYMAETLRILRQMAIEYDVFDYRIFQRRVAEARFETAQQKLLDVRMGVLESFLDLTGTHNSKMLFEPGEVTIMDMSCPFVDVNTACIMFKCGLQHYLQSRASGKLIVLDEAHKYMLDVPAAKELNALLFDTIRMQRHTGTRVLISTQEPTLLTDLIPLCSIAVIHRFSSPEWFAAIQRHIRIPEAEREKLMERIEDLPTGTAIVYSPNTTLGREMDGTIRKGTATMMEVKMRQRITADGGGDKFAV